MCRQVQRRLDMAFGEFADPVLQGLWVHAVVPEAGARSLLVQVVVSDSTPAAQVLARLNAARGRLRGEVAAAINRKRTPHLQFIVVPEEAMAAPDTEVDRG